MEHVQPNGMPTERRRYYRLHHIVICTLLLGLFSLVTRPTAWGGWSMAVVGMAVFFLYHFATRVQLGLIEFTLTLLLLGHALLLTMKHLWPVFQGSEVDWFILPLTLGVAAWILGGALWSGWITRTLQLKGSWPRLQVLVIGWLMPVALPGFVASLLLTIAGMPTYILQHIGLRQCHLAHAIYQWWVILMPVAAFLCYRVLAEGIAIHAAARTVQTDEDLIADAAHFGAPADPIAPDPRAAL